MKILPAQAQDLADVAVMFREYAALVQEALCFQNFDQELAGLPGEYAPPAGALLIARDGAAAAGCVGLRRLDARTVEMKRMYVRDAFRGTGLGRRLAEEAIAEARQRGAERLVLDTLPKLKTAIALYGRLGFRECAPYLLAPTPGAVCLELRFS